MVVKGKEVVMTIVMCLFINQEIKIKLRKIDKRKRKSKENIRNQVYHDMQGIIPLWKTDYV